MRHLLCFFAASWLCLPAHALPHEGGEVCNGGDSVLCADDGHGSFRGYYSLDYLLTLQEDNSDLIKPATWEESRDRLQRLLDEKYPALGFAFSRYTRYLGNHTRYDLPRVWEAAQYHLVPIDDQQIERGIPANCYHPDAKSKINLIQTVARTSNPGVVIYAYDKDVFRALRETNPLQYSFLLVHEWLWDLTDNPQTVRRVNRMLHSTSLEKMSADEFRTALEHVGLKIDPYPYVPVCERSPIIRDLMVGKEHRPCAELDHGQVGNLSELELDNVGLTELRFGDLSGMSGLRRIHINHNPIQHLPSGLFGKMTDLETLDLSDNALEDLPDGIFDSVAGYGQPSSLSLAGNRLTRLPVHLFEKLHALRLLDLSRNRFTALPGQLFLDANFHSIDLSANRLVSVPEELFLPQVTRELAELNLSQNPIPEKTVEQIREKGSKIGKLLLPEGMTRSDQL